MEKKTKNKKMGLISGFISSEKGQRFFNFAYSIGAAIVIWGALFKILHLPGGNTLLSIGMGTEVLMFLLTAFDRPPKEYKWEDVFPVLSTNDPEDRPEFSGAGGSGAAGGGIVINGGSSGEGVAVEGGNGGSMGGGIIINGGGFIGGGVVGGGVSAGDTEFIQEGNIEAVGIGTSGVVSITPAQAQAAVGLPAELQLDEQQTTSLSDSIAKMAAAADQLSRMAELTSATQTYLDQMSQISAEMQRLHDTTNALNNVSEVLLKSYEAITQHSAEISDSSTGYVEQMQSLSRNIGGLNTIYEIQLKSVSSQLDAIDRVNRGIKDIRDMYEKSAEQSSRYCEETEKMARYMQQLNQVYEKMITAMTINMYRTAPTPPPMPNEDNKD